MKIARIGVLLDRKAAARRQRYGINVFEAFVGEVLAHAGVPFEWIESADEIAQTEPDVLLIALAEEDQPSAEALWSYAERGGTLVSFAGLRALASKLGCRERPEVPVGYASMSNDSGDSGRPLRFLGAIPWERTEAGNPSCVPVGTVRKESPSGATAGALLQRFAVGDGTIDRWSVNIPKTIVLFQQGIGPVLYDGVPAEDGTGAVDDGILKADDRIGLDWEWDRLQTETGAPYFAFPYADWWKEQLIGHVLRCATAKRMTVPLVGYWPDGVSAVVTVSHDSDHNIDESAESTLAVLKECGFRSTWCMIEPGYSPHIYERVNQEGHELAFHYNAMDSQGGRWGEAEFVRQLEWLKQAIGAPAVTSNKNHYTRFEGWGELFEWCEKHGIQADQTRGPSKKGNIGFLFGTCHPYFPISSFHEGNRMYDVLEISFLTQDLDHRTLADSSVIVPFLEQVAKAEGVAHFLFHQVHIHEQPPVAQAVRKLAAEARKRGFQFWTSAEINRWERARRNVKIKAVDSDGRIAAEGVDRLENVVVYIPIVDVSESDPSNVVRFGVPCRKTVVNQRKEQAATTEG